MIVTFKWLDGRNQPKTTVLGHKLKKVAGVDILQFGTIVFHGNFGLRYNRYP